MATAKKQPEKKEPSSKPAKTLPAPPHVYRTAKGEAVCGADWSSGQAKYSHAITVKKEHHWIAGLNGTRILYRLPEIASAPDVILTESEPAADACTQAGFAATTCPGGWEGWIPDFRETMRGKKVTLLVGPAEKRAELIFQSLYGRAHDVRMISYDAGIEQDMRLGNVNRSVLKKLLTKPSQRDFVAMIAAKKKRLTDTGNAEMLGFLHGDGIRYCPQWGCWLVWSEGHWRRDDCGLIHDLAKRTADQIWDEVREHHNKDQDHFNELVRWAQDSRSRAARSNMVKLARVERHLQVMSDELDRNPNLLNLQNGTLDLLTREFREHDRTDYQTKQCPVEYDPEAVLSARWLMFLHEIFADIPKKKELIEYLKMCIGITLTGETPVQAFWFMYGKGANGKSVFIETLLAILGPYAKRTPTETLMHSERTSSIPNDIARLQGVRMVAASEVEEGRRWNESRIKDLTGGDTITARFLQKEFFEFQPQFKLWVAGNHKPALRGTDHGIQRRVKLIPFLTQIPPEKRVPLKEMKQRMLAEAAGIINWALDGLKDFREDGYWEPESVTSATKEYFSENDLLGQFLDEACRVDPSCVIRIAKKDLYAHFSTYCEESGMRPMTAVKFSLLLSERGFQEVKTHGEREWLGIARA